MKLKGIETGDYSDFKEHLKTSVAEAARNEWPVGYQSLQYHILEAQSEADPLVAKRALDSVNFGPNDFPWLEDMKLLAKCELAHRANPEARETELRAQFFMRQPLLYEPDSALDFTLLTYQEDFKGQYPKTIKELRG